jgi:cyclic pyranopterin phosphate synthase
MAPAQKLHIKINMVPLRGVNDGEITDFALFARDHDVSVRFIELMPLGFAAAYTMVPNGEALEQITHVIKNLVPVDEIKGNGPAVYYTSPGMKGDIGFISAVSSCFCASCNRLRLDSLGQLKPCLSSDLFCDLKALVRGGADDDVIKDAILNTVALKPRAHVFADTANTTLRRTNMFKIGG